MPKYNEFLYGVGEKYGVTGNLSYSAEPVIASALFYDRVKLTWQTPTFPSGDVGYSEFRIVRSQEGFPQTQEDGVIIYTSYGAPGVLTIEDSSSTEDAPLQSGRYAYYRAWIKKLSRPAGVLTSTWTPAGDDLVLVPSPHNLSASRETVYSGVGADGKTTDDLKVIDDPRVNPVWSTTHDRFMELLPSVFTSTTNSALDVRDDEYDSRADASGSSSNSLISKFLSGFSFTMDEFLTYASLIKPDNSVRGAGPAGVFLQSQQLGLTDDVESVTDTQKRLIRNAVGAYKKKGTAPGIELLAQSMTGYDATVTSTSDNRGVVVSVAASWYQEAAGVEITTFIAPNNFVVGEYVTVENMEILTGEDLNVTNLQIVLTASDFFAVANPGVSGFAAGPGYATVVSGGVSRAHNLLLSHEDATFDIESWKEAAYQAANATPVEDAPPVGNWVNFTQNITMSVVSDQSPDLITQDTGSRILDNTYCMKVVPGAASTAISLGTDDPVGKGLPVFANVDYTVSAYIKEVEAVGGEGTEPNLAIIWYDRKGAAIKRDTSSTLTGLSDTWARKSFTATAPSTAIYAGIVVTFGEAEAYYIDRVQFEQNGSATAYQEPRAVVLTLSPTAINYVKDPAFMKDAVASTPTYWTSEIPVAGSTATLTIGEGAVGSDDEGINVLNSSAVGTTTTVITYYPNVMGTPTPIVVPSGQYYSWSIYVKDVSTAVPYVAAIQFTGLTGTPIGLPVVGAPTLVSVGAWTRVTVTAKAPSNAPTNYVVAIPFISSGLPPVAGTVALFNAAQFEAGYAPSDYFDGSLTNDGNVWQGVANNSYSGKYPAQSTKATRLEAEIKNYLGFSTPWFIDLYNGQYAKGLS